MGAGSGKQRELSRGLQFLKADLCMQGPEDLFETVSQALLNAVDRDALSGWGAHVYIIEKDKVTKRLLKGRQD